MKIKNNTILCLFALTTLAAGFGSCQSEDDKLNSLPAGSFPLVLGDVTVAGTQTVNNRAAGGSTRAAIAENASGYSGIRKSAFVNGDVLNLTLTNDGGTTNTPVTATLTGGAWVLSSGKVFITPGVTEITATHTATAQAAGIATDNLAAANADCAVTGGKVTIAMKHAGAMIDITPDATDGGAITSVKVNTDVPTMPEEETAGAGGGTTTMHYRTLIADATVVNSISAEIGGTTYVATLATPITVAANKRYPMALTFKHQTLTATVSAPQDWTDGGTINPAGYTYIIDSPEALAQLAKDVNDKAVTTGTTVLQTADIDLSKLKPAGEAGTNPLTGSAYTYTATADSWVSIGNSTSSGFEYKYNGNGHTISNLRGSTGLFGKITGGTLTGIHLRGVSLTEVKGTVGALANDVGFGEPRIVLCSATGSITTVTDNGTSNSHIGGLIGTAWYGAGTPHITRCSAAVDIDASGLSEDGYVGGFAGFLDDSYVIGCMATGNVNGGTLLFAGGFAGRCSRDIYYCMATGNVSGSKSGAFTGQIDTTYGSSVFSCYATGTVTGAKSDFVYGIVNSPLIQDCAYTGSLTTSNTGITGNVEVADLYGTLTAGSASVTNVYTLHWSAADGYTLTEVTRTWHAADVWKDNGTAAPTIDMTYEGAPMYNGQPANRLAIPGKTAYYVAPVGAGYMAWNDAVADGVCPDGWHVPTKEEFIAMGVDGDYVANQIAFLTAFPSTRYWTASRANDTKVYCIHAYDGGYVFLDESGSSIYEVRCVRLK